jgi:hypothetical protein
MTAAVELVARLRARGVTLEPDGPTLVVRSATAVPPDEVEALRRHKAEVLALLRAAWPPWVDLNPHAVREALGARPSKDTVASLRRDVLAAVRQLEAEITSGIVGPRQLLVRGRPLGDWLDLAAVARLLREWSARPTSG